MGKFTVQQLHCQQELFQLYQALGGGKKTLGAEDLQVTQAFFVDLRMKVGNGKRVRFGLVWGSNLEMNSFLGKLRQLYMRSGISSTIYKVYSNRTIQ